MAVSAGNAGLATADTCPTSSTSALFVGATDVTTNLTRAWFSNYGPCVTIGAPGVQNLVAIAGSSTLFGNASGTSLAAPLVAGAAAAAWTLTGNTAFTAAQIQLLLTTSATADVPYAMLYTGGNFGSLPPPTSASITSHTPTLNTPTTATSATPTTGSSSSPICSNNFTAYTQGTWSQVCRVSNAALRPVACLRDAQFAAAFPSGLLIGCAGGAPLPGVYRLNFTTSYAISVFLPVVAPAGVLARTAQDPTPRRTGDGGALAGNLIAAKLNIGWDTYDPNFSLCPTPLGALCFASGDCVGYSYSNVTAASDLVLGGCTGGGSCPAGLEPLCALTPAQLSTCLANANANFGNGNQVSAGTLQPC